ncbi:MAG: response regulator [Phycisphaerae bacterium]|nr:response regulator [Phycisphaerae bacterium]
MGMPGVPKDITTRSDRRRAIFEGTLVAGVFLLVGMLASFGLWRSSVQSLQTQLNDEMARLATVAAGLVDPELHRTFTDPLQMKSDEYARAVAPLRRFREHAPGVKYVYTAIRVGDEVHFILDAAEPGDHDGDGNEDQAAIDEVYDDCEETIHIAFGLDGAPGVATASPEPYSDEWGTFITGYAPIHDKDGNVIAVVGVDMTADRYIDRLAMAQSRTLWGLVPAGVVSIAIGLAAFALRRHTLSLKRAEANASAALRDSIAELAERNVELDQLRRKAEEVAEMKASFLANMSHEIRTPLTAVLGYLDLLEESLNDDHSPYRTSRLHHLRTIRNAGEHLLALINDILDLSKIEAGRMTLEAMPTDVAHILNDTDGILHSRAAEKGLELSFALETPIPREIISDPTRVRQILINLAGNAVKFTERGSVRVVARVAGAHLEIDVEDSGSGMTAAQAERLFRPFTQADASVTRRHGGTGLGLSICRRLSEMLGGAVELTRTEPGVGSVFRLRLPLRAAEGTPMVHSLGGESCDLAGSVRTAMAITLHGRILLAEDGKDNQRLIAHHLRKAGADVEIAENGIEALRLMDRANKRGAPFDLLLTDVQMPEMDGCTLARTVRSRALVIPIIALTAHAMPEDRMRCEEAGCDDYATKPIDRAKLLQVCARWLGQRAAA